MEYVRSKWLALVALAAACCSPASHSFVPAGPGSGVRATPEIGADIERWGAGRATVAPSDSVSRSIAGEALQAVIHSHSDEVQRCFERAQIEQLFLRVRIEMSASVAPDGRVSEVTTSAASDGTSRLQACIRDVAMRLEFPAPARGRPLQVKLTFVLE